MSSKLVCTAHSANPCSLIRDVLHIGSSDCLFKTKCIVLGEMVVYSDKEKRIMPFSKIRKHVSRSGSFIGTLHDSLPHEWEHLMIVFFDVLQLDDYSILRHCLQERRNILRNLVRVIPGRSMRSEWTMLDFKTGDGITDLKQAFARNLANRQEGLVLKPLHAPYFPLVSDQGHRKAGFFIKLKKDYLADMGGERDLGDFAVIGASFDARVAPKSDVKPLHWTHFHLGCCTNKHAVQRFGNKPEFKVVAVLSLDKCIPKSDVKYLNIQGYVRQGILQRDGSTSTFDVVSSNSLGQCMTIAFKKPFVAEILGSGYEKLQNDAFEMLRHPRVKKIHHDRTWEDTVTLVELEVMAKEKWDLPNADNLDGHAKDVALLVKKYVKEMGGSQLTATTDDTTQTTQRTTPQSSQESIRHMPTDSVVLESQEHTGTNVSSTQCSGDGSTQGNGIQASREVRSHVREDTKERQHSFMLSTPKLPAPLAVLRSLSKSTARRDPLAITKRSFGSLISPPTSKRRQILGPIDSKSGNRHLGSFGFDSQDQTIHIYANAGLKVQVHARVED